MTNEDAEEKDEGFYVALEATREMLRWRAFRLACFIGQKMVDYERTHNTDGDPWMVWRQGNKSVISEFVSRLDHEAFTILLTCRELQFMVSFPSEDLLTLPSGGELTPVPLALWTESTDCFDDWDELLGKPPDGVTPWNVLRAAYVVAVQDQREHGIEKAGRPAEELKGELAQVRELVEQANALQMPIVDLLEKIVKNTERLNKYQAEEKLKASLGATYGLLCHEARMCLIAAEQNFCNPEYAAPGDIVLNLAKAFELQLKQVFLREFAGYLKGRHGIKQFPVNAATAQELIIKDGRPEFRTNLGKIKRAFGPGDEKLEGFCHECGIDLPSLRDAINEVPPLRDRAAHRHDIQPTEVKEIRESWLGDGTGGIFRLIVSERFPPPSRARRQWN